MPRARTRRTCQREAAAKRLRRHCSSASPKRWRRCVSPTLKGSSIPGRGHPPRRLTMSTLSRSSDKGPSRNRNSAADASREALTGRNRFAHVRPCLAANCRRRISVNRGPGSASHPRTALHAPDLHACSSAQSASAWSFRVDQEDAGGIYAYSMQGGRVGEVGRIDPSDAAIVGTRQVLPVPGSTGVVHRCRSPPRAIQRALREASPDRQAHRQGPGIRCRCRRRLLGVGEVPGRATALRCWTATVPRVRWFERT